MGPLGQEWRDLQSGLVPTLTQQATPIGSVGSSRDGVTMEKWVGDT